MDSISYPEFSRIYNGLQKESNQLYRLLSKHYGISDSECWILYVLREEGRPLTQTELCNTLYLSKQTVNSALKSLEADGYIRLGKRMVISVWNVRPATAGAKIST